MTPATRERLKELFQAALDREPAFRSAFLAEACGDDDPQLKRDVEALVASHEQAGGFLESQSALEEAAAALIEGSPTLALAAGDRLGPYEVVEFIGAGGMGEVYRAWDARLSRNVALKVMRGYSATEPAALRRFESEARAAGAISHPNIVAVFDVDCANGTPYVVSELLEGETLGRRLRLGALPRRKCLDYAVQIAQGLAAAHAEGVVHRDLKPDNVFLTKQGRVKILDFGLARRTGDANDTAAGSVLAKGSESRPMGTLGYVAPEQLQGRLVDRRADIFSLGAILYEMLTDRRALPHGRALERVPAIEDWEPAPLRPEDHVPPALEGILWRCLEMQPEERFQSAEDLGFALQALSISAPQAPPVIVARAGQLKPWVARAAAVALIFAAFLVGLRWWTQHRHPAVQLPISLAVLPFVNLSGDPDQEYLSDGLTEELITQLGSLDPGLLVIARTSVMKYKGSNAGVDRIGRDLAIQYVVEGSVRRSADRVRVAAQLVRVDNQSHVWAASYDCDLKDALALQANMARVIADRVDIQLRPAPSRRRPASIDPRSSEFYLRGRYVWNRYTEGGWNKAIDYFKQAIAIDPNHSAAWAGLADSYYQLSSLVLLPAEVIPKARTAALTALAIDDSLAEGHAALGMIKAQYDWDATGAVMEFKRAIQLNPNHAAAHQWLGMCAFSDARFEDALASFEKARQLDPLSLFIAVTAVWPRPHLGQHREALKQLEDVIEMHPDVPEVAAYLHELRGDLYFQEGRPTEAVKEWLQGFRTKALTGDGTHVTVALRKAYASHGLKGYWEKQLELATTKYQADVRAATDQVPARYVSPYRLAELHARLGHRTHAFMLLEECVRNRDENLRWLKAESLTLHSPWENLRLDPIFAGLLRSIGLER